MRAHQLAFAATIVLVLAWQQSGGNATEVSSLTSEAGRPNPNTSALLGSAYNSEKQRFVGHECVTGQQTAAGLWSSAFSLDQSLTESEAKEHLGFGAEARGRFGLTSVAASAKFLRESSSTKYSVSAIWLSDYYMPVTRFSGALTKTTLGASVEGSSERWAETCGDEYVAEIVHGARLMFSIRVEFASFERKQEFEAKFRISGSVGSAKAELEQATQQFSRDAKVTVSARQFGGDVSKITHILGTSDSATAGFVQCSLGNFAECANVIGRAIDYARDTKNGFPSQIAQGATPGATALIYRTNRYSAAGIFPEVSPLLDAANRAARRRIEKLFDEQFQLQILADQLKQFRNLGSDRLDRIDQQRRIIDENIRLILEKVEICFSRINECASTTQAFRVHPIDQSVFDLPPLPEASFRLFTTSRGVWTREASIGAFYTDKNTPRIVDQGGQRRLLDLSLDEGTSIVLFIEGFGLKDATLYFENVKLGVIPLQPTPTGFSEKVGNGFALIVVDTNRVIDGWDDVDIWMQRVKLIEALGDADGIFYVLVEDQFGRSIRFDIQYERYRQLPHVGPFPAVEISYRNRFWDRNSDGTSIVGESIWTESRTIRIRSSGYPKIVS